MMMMGSKVVVVGKVKFVAYDFEVYCDWGLKAVDAHVP